ncbi:MAG: hypothetical protein Q9M19_00160, partial [Mariprofundaceae bacterium]|nr:hypothetical protein [Mariprofundaceae bacterium]
MPNALSWLDKFSASFASDSAGTDGQYAAKKFLVYVLTKNTASHDVEVTFRSVAFLKRGNGLTKGSEVYFSNLRDIGYYRAAYIQDEDIEILRLLTASNNGYGNNCFLQSAASAIALPRMVQTGRCFIENHQRYEPLTWGEERVCAQEWLYDNQGNAQLQLQIKPQAVLIPSEPACYLDMEQHQAGLLGSMDYNAQQLQMLLNAPVIPADLVDAFSQQTVMSMPKAALTPPKAIESESITGEKPVPHLYLHTVTIADDRLRLGRLRFAYAGHEVSIHPDDEQVMVKQGNKIIAISRDAEAEDELVNQAYSFGIAAGLIEEDNDLFLFFKTEHSLENDTLWAEFISQSIPQLEGKGWQVEIADDFNMQVHEAEDWHADIEEQGNDWFDLRFDIDINGKKQALLP